MKRECGGIFICLFLVWVGMVLAKLPETIKETEESQKKVGQYSDKNEKPIEPVSLAATPSKPLAWVGKAVITEGDLARAVNAYSQSLRQRGKPLLPDFKDSVLDILIESELLYQAGRKLEIPDLNERVEQMYKVVSRRFPSEEVLGEELARQGMTIEILKANLKRELIVKNLLTEKVYDKITVTDEEVAKYYRDNRDKLKQPGEIPAWDKIRDRIKAVLKGQKASKELKKYVVELKKKIKVRKLTTAN